MPRTPTNELNALIHEMAIYDSETAYRKLFGFLFNPLFRFSFCMLNSREAAEEVASDVMLRIWQKRMELLQVEHVQVYAFVIARNLSLNVLRKNAGYKIVSLEDIHVDVNNETPSPEEILIDAENKAGFEMAVNALPTRCKIVFKLIKEEGLSYKEVAKVLTISPKTVDAHLVTAMAKLSQALRAKFYCS